MYMRWHTGSSPPLAFRRVDKAHSKKETRREEKKKVAGEAEQRRGETNTNADSSNDIYATKNLFLLFFFVPSNVLKTPGRDATRRMIYKQQRGTLCCCLTTNRHVTRRLSLC